jgi:4-methyl-5(b-hydroxyethyl)-thiazole monophosphate biosynthesis
MRSEKRVLIPITQGSEISEFAAFFDVFGWARVEAGLPLTTTVAGTADVVTCSFGLRVHTDALLDDIDPSDFDGVAIPGGFGDQGFFEGAYSEAFLRPIRIAADAGRPVASVCTGALPIARSGALKGRRGTTYHLGGGLRRQQLAEFGVEVVDEPIVTDGGIVTSTGPATAFDVAFGLITTLFGDEATAELRRLMAFTAG